MDKQILSHAVVEVVLDRGPDRPEKVLQWGRGSGFLLQGRRILTAAHVVKDGRVYVRTIEAAQKGIKYAAEVVLFNLELDLAIVDITDPTFLNEMEGNLQFAVPERDHPGLLKDCWAIGFPAFKERVSKQSDRIIYDSIQVEGEIALGSNLKSETLEFRVLSTPKEQPSTSPLWDGISGAVAFTNDPQAGDCVIGVVIEHHSTEGVSSLTIMPIGAISKLDESEAHKWWNLLGISIPDSLLHLSSHSVSDRARRDYLRAVEKHYGTIKLVLEKSKNLSMDTAFQPLELEEDTQESHTITVEHLNDELAKNESKCIIILGKPGSGKSTLLRYLAREQARKALSNSTVPIPILIDLKLVSSNKPFIDYLPDVVKRLSLHPRQDYKLEDAVVDGPAFIYLDGLDEISLLRADFIQQIDDFLVASSDKNITVFISSRSNGFRDVKFSIEYSTWKLKPLSSSLQRSLADRLLLEIQQLLPASTLYKPMTFLTALETNKINQWKENPLLFSLAAVEFVKTGVLAMNNSELYKNTIDGMLTRYPDAKSLRNSLGALALELFLRRKGRSFTRVDLELIMERTTAKWHKDWDNDRSIERIIQSGLLDMIATDAYSFLHQTFQEYLAAEFLATRSIDRALEEVNQLVNSADDPSCRQVIIELAYLIHEKKFTKIEVILEEDALYQRLMICWHQLKEEYDRRDKESNPAATGIS